ncbi:hypothetical protein ACLBV5_11505 [Brevundimonas sp. M1A4_2e]|uniref:hypothetical protein n=1 Tax=Brevundimonas diminuta TaxID=293 RepID=UPI00190491A5|nr:hypothetical protein [Brevundimonas diminuta]MBK1969960.1 hypothetical protein [Brevundimonas diminuta]
MRQLASSRAASPDVQLFDPDHLQLGDVVLERGGGLNSAFVAAVTGGRFSHAMIWVGEDFIEAMPDGVRSLSFARVPVVQPKRWALLRVAPENAGHAARAAIEARNLAFNTYDALGAVLTTMKPRRAAKVSSRFCSQLVAEAYLNAGLTLFPNRLPPAVTPNMLRRSPRLLPVCLPLVPSSALFAAPYPAEFLDRNAAFRNSPMAVEGALARTLFATVRKDVRRFILPEARPTPPGNLNDLLSLLPLIDPAQAAPVADRLLAEMTQSGYFHLLTADLAAFLQDAEPTGEWRRQAPAWRTSRDRHRQNAQAYLGHQRAMPHRLWRRLHAMHTDYGRTFEALIRKVDETP